MTRYLWPLAGFAALLVFLAIGLRLKPQELPSALLNKPLPALRLSTVDSPEQYFDTRDMAGKVWVLNVWASWCGPCRAEHAVVQELAATRLATVVGLNYNDLRSDSQQWLREMGNPYLLSAFDGDGRAGIELGVYGVPETFVIDQQGRVRLKLTGALTHERLQSELLPALKALSHG